MKISGLITIYSGKPHGLAFAAQKGLAGIPFGKCVENFEGGQTFEFESEDSDLQSLASRLIEARKAGELVFWAVEWHLLNEIGVVVDRGLMTEDDFDNE